MKLTENESVFFAVIIGVLVLLLLIRFALSLKDFKRELYYIKTEIRNTVGEERRYWKREKKKLWLSLIPFFRR